MPRSNCHVAGEEILHALGKLFPLDNFQVCAKRCKTLIPHIQQNMYKWHAYCDNCAVRQAITSDVSRRSVRGSSAEECGLPLEPAQRQRVLPQGTRIIRSSHFLCEPISRFNKNVTNGGREFVESRDTRCVPVWNCEVDPEQKKQQRRNRIFQQPQQTRSPRRLCVLRTRLGGHALSS